MEANSSTTTVEKLMSLNSSDISQYTDVAINFGIKIVGAIVIFVIGKWIAKGLTNLAKKLMAKGNVDTTLISFVGNIVYVLLMAVVILAAVGNLGIQTTSFIAILGAAGLAVGLALQGTLSNVGAAVLIILFRPFKVGDVVDLGGVVGVVEEISLFSTTLGSFDGKTIIIPNGSIISGTITNISAKDTKRLDLTFGIGYDDDLKLAKKVLEEISVSDDRVLKDPAPYIAVSELGDSSVNFVYRVWVKTSDLWDVRFDTIEKVKLTFDEKGISIPYPQMDVHQKP